MSQCLIGKESVVLAALLLVPGVAHAQGSLSRVSPNGGRAGSQVTLNFGGDKIPETATLVVHGEGIRALGPFQKGVGKIEIAADARPGVRELRLVGPKGATSPRPFAIGTLAELDEKEPNNQLTQAQKLDTLPVTLNGTLPTRPDIDVFQVSLKKGECLVVAGESRGLGAPTNLLVRIRDAGARELLIQMDHRTRDPLVGFTAPADGIYFLELQEVMNNYSGINADYVYRVTVTKGPWVDYTFPPSLQRGAASRLTAVGWNLGGKNGPSELEVETTVPANAGNTHPVAVPGVPYPVAVAVGSAPHSREKEPEDPALAVPVPVPGTVSGAFGTPGDMDRYQFSAKAREVVELDVDARELTSFADPVMVILDASGKTLATADDSDGTRDPRLVWTAPADGNYTVLLRDVASGSRGGPEFFYRLTLAKPEPSLQVTTKDPTLELKPGGKLEVELSIAQAYQPGEISFQVEGLPAGVTATLPKTAGSPQKAGKATAKLVLTAAADAKPGHALLRITALPMGHPELKTFVTAGWDLSKDRSGVLATGKTDGLLLLVSAP